MKKEDRDYTIKNNEHIKYKGYVRYSGNHYYWKDVVYGSKIKFENNKTFIFDDESYIIRFSEFSFEEERYEWVQVYNLVKEIKEELK